MLDDVHIYDGYCRHCARKREDRMERELTRLRRVEQVARAALANGNVHNGNGSDDADALAAVLGVESPRRFTEIGAAEGPFPLGPEPTTVDVPLRSQEEESGD